MVQPRGTKNKYAEICRRIKAGTVVPVIGNTLRNDRIFDGCLATKTGGQRDEAQPAPTVDEALSIAWANQLEYPLNDTSNLARVALYNRVLANDDEEAIVNYLLFLKSQLLEVARNDPQRQGRVPVLESQTEQQTFSYLAGELEYPCYTEPGEEDPLRRLAHLPLPIYITTSFYDFLERALEAENRSPLTQVCFWRGEPANIQPAHKTAYDLVPSKDRPVVYHLFGWEFYPSTMVLSEGDYLDFLMRVITAEKSTSTNTTDSLLPPYLRTALFGLNSTLTLIGYRLQDWDFRVLYRLIQAKHVPRYNVLVQVNAEQLARELKGAQVNDYLRRYFQDTFTLQWGSSEDYVVQLCEEYEKWIQPDS